MTATRSEWDDRRDGSPASRSRRLTMRVMSPAVMPRLVRRFVRPLVERKSGAVFSQSSDVAHREVALQATLQVVTDRNLALFGALFREAQIELVSTVTQISTSQSSRRRPRGPPCRSWWR